MERYVREYAKARIKDAKDNQLMRDDIKNLITEKIERAMYLRMRGIITANEAIKMILEA